MTRFAQHARAMLYGAFLGTAVLAGPALAQDDPPGRVGRIADLNGSVSWFDAEQGQWTPAERNQPLTSGDRLSTAIDGRAELRVGSTVLRLSNSSELEVLRLDDDKLAFQLHSGSLALRVRSREVAAEVELLTAEARLLPQRAGHYRVDRVDDTTLAGSWRGELQVADAGGLLVATGQRTELYRDGRGRDLRQATSTLPNDGFNAWVVAEDQRDERSASSRYVSPEMTGAEELDRHGRWEQHPEYGALWQPAQVASDWAPYRYGRWAWVQPWGWTWVDDAPWGFAPFHYGRWVFWRNNWCWAPGAYVARPVFAPALVAWVGGPRWGVSVQIGGPNIGWVPLAPREVYRPQYRHTPIYVDRVNPGPPSRWLHPPRQVPTGPIMYGNQGVPNGVTVVPNDALLRRQPVQRAVVDAREWRDQRDQRDQRDRRDPREGQGSMGPQPQQRQPQQPLPPEAPPPGPRWQGPQSPREGRPAMPATPGAVMPAPRPEQRDSPAVMPPRGGPRFDPPQEGDGRRQRPRPPAPEPAAPPAATVAPPAQAPAQMPAPAPARPAPLPQPAPQAAPPRPAPERAEQPSPPMRAVPPAPRPPAAERPRERERDDDRKRRPDAPQGGRERENLR